MSQCFLLNVSRPMSQNGKLANHEVSFQVHKEKVMSYEEKSVGSTPFFKCEACPYMALAEDDIKFHLFTFHPDLAKKNGLADNIQIQCPGCSSVFDAEETLRTHLRGHHKMGIKDVKKMIKSLVQIALKNATLKKEEFINKPPLKIADTNKISNGIPQVIEIVPDVVHVNNTLPKGVAYISVDELHKMSAPNFEKVDPKEIIQEASINIVYANEVPTQYVNVSSTPTSSNCNVVKIPSVTPDLISSSQPVLNTVSNTMTTINESNQQICKGNRPIYTVASEMDKDIKESEIEKNLGKLCSEDSCKVRLKDIEKLLYHKKCHYNSKLQCPECNRVWLNVNALHTHLWKIHAIDLELPTCEICGFKTYDKHRLYNIHMKCHSGARNNICPICFKSFKNVNQLSKHKLIHVKEAGHICSICQREFSNRRSLEAHINAVHEKLKPYKCSHCDHSTARKSQMTLHMRSHTGDKPYSCDKCTFRSSDHNSMRRHKKMHTNEGMYKCKYCPYSTIQSTVFATHMVNKHPNVESDDVLCCPYCPFKSVNKDKYAIHQSTHADKEEIIKMKGNKPNWTIPSDIVNVSTDITTNGSSSENITDCPKSDNEIPIEVFDCDSLSESITQEYPKSYSTDTVNEVEQTNYSNQMTDLSKDDKNSDCIISETSNDILLERQYTPQLTLQNITYESTQSNLHEFLNTSASLEQNLLQNNTVTVLPPNHMGNFPIRLPLVPQISVRKNIMLKSVDKISLPMSKVTGPIIKPSQILPVPLSSHSPINISYETEGVPRKKPKISVKSNLILKGPDKINMFHSQQQMAFKRLEDNERFGLAGPVTFNNLITTQFMQLPPEPALSESPSSLISYPQEPLLEETSSTPVDNGMNDSPQIFSFSQPMNVNTLSMLPPPVKIQASDPSYIKIEATIKQNNQSPSLERMCNANILNSQTISREYKASPPLEELHKNMSEIKNEVKSDTYYNMPISNAAANQTLLDQYLMDNIIGEQFQGHLDLSGVVLSETTQDQQNDVIEIDDNSDDSKLPPRFDMSFPLESLYMLHNDFHFLDNDMPSSSVPNDVTDMNRIITEVPIINQKDNLNLNTNDTMDNNHPTSPQGKKDPMMNTTLRMCINKINVKNIELMKN